MSGWEAGDLALCIDDSAGFKGAPCPCKAGNIYRVEAVVLARKGYIDEGAVGLRLEGVTFPCPRNADNARRYRKIKPDTEGANEDDATWLKDLLSKKVKA